ncbi:MAG: hypothetical protein P1P84_07385 [Deferrisomatales bacterium]|nr:hypothetical protein [Deferrisomatales bacterium]
MSALDSLTGFYQTATGQKGLSGRESVLVRLAASMALGCAP